VESRNRLGIYLSKDRASVVWPGSQSRADQVADCFTISIQNPDEHSWQNLATLISQSCAERKINFSDVAVALDCSMFMQHSVHSEFKDIRKVAATVRFDTEETLATDISGMAIAFKITSGDQTGSKLTVFTAQQKVLSDILLALQANGIDPVTVEPDVICLSRYIHRHVTSLKAAHGDTLFAILARSRGYLLSFSKTQDLTMVRTFLLAPVQNRTDVLARDIRITTALDQSVSPMACLKVFDAASGVDTRQLSEKLGIAVESLDMAGLENTASQNSAQGGSDAVDFAVAYGSILTHVDKSAMANFRSDFLPFQGKKLRLQKTMKLLGISLTILLLALGVYLQTDLWKVNHNRDALHRKFAPDYLAVVLDDRKMPAFKEAVGKLGRLFRQIESEKKGLITNREAASAKLAMILESFNNCAKPTDLNIESVTITAANIVVVGDTSSRASTLRLFEEIKKTGFDVLSQNLDAKGGRDNFSVTVIPGKSSGSAQ